MPSDKNDRDIEIIPPGQSGQERRAEWIYISTDGPKAFRALPLHQRILIGAAWLAALLVVGVILFLILASAVLIWIPLLLATALITAAAVFLRGKFRR